MNTIFSRILYTDMKQEKKQRLSFQRKEAFEAASAYKGKHISVQTLLQQPIQVAEWTKGASAQEECLCRVSTLYKCISASEITEAFHKKTQVCIENRKDEFSL